MLSAPVIVVVSFLYLCLLFAIAYYGDNRSDRGQSLIANPYTYALSIAVYCTSWTFFGSVGRAASSGAGFLPIYLGPTLTFVAGWFVVRKILRIAKQNRITSIADFIASRYGKSLQLGALVTVIAVVGILPYISLQLKAISTGFTILSHYPDIAMPSKSAQTPLLQDTALYVAIIMGAFAILFGTRHIDASEHHQGMVAAIAFESLVKLIAFLAVGLFVTFVVFDGFSDIFQRASESGALSKLFTIEGVSAHTNWVTLTLLSMAAIITLPRQFQVVIVENVEERHLAKALWLFPLYLLLINIFVLPIAFAGLMMFPQGGVDADTFVMTLPMKEQWPMLALAAFIGGLSAATGMIIVETVALATMVCNDLVMPALLRIAGPYLARKADLTGTLLAIRRGTIVALVLLGYAYVRLIGDSYALVTIGLVSFVAAMQFAPAILSAIYWKNSTKSGALAGLAGGFVLWLYTLLLPSFARSGWIPGEFVDHGLFGIALLKPYALFGLEGLDAISHATIWTMIFNIGLLVGVSLITPQSVIERRQAVQFVDVFKRTQQSVRTWRGKATVSDLNQLMTRFLGEARAEAALARYERETGRALGVNGAADSEFISYVERQLTGAIGAASSRIMVASVLREEMHDIDEVLHILDEASQLVVYSRRLEEKSKALEDAKNELTQANDRLKQLDKMKDDFIATVSHELRTPLTSIRSFSEILRDNPDLEAEQRQEFAEIIVKESERLSRLINDILDIAKMEAGQTEWNITEFAPREVVEQALAATQGLFAKKPELKLETRIAADIPPILADADRLTQVIVNLVSNAVKFSAEKDPFVRVAAWAEDGYMRVDVTDNGIGIAPKDHAKVFERFQQAGDVLVNKAQGTGLGLPICRQILERFDGAIWLDSALGKGSTFSFKLPLAATARARQVGAQGGESATVGAPTRPLLPVEA